MAKDKSNRKFWDRYAKFYDGEVLRFSRAAYNEIYARMGRTLRCFYYSCLIK